MESKSCAIALITLAVASLVNCAAVGRELRKITNRITTKMNNMEEDIKNMQLNIADLEFENQELRKELDVEKNRTGELEIKLNSALSSSPVFPDIGAKDSTVQEKFQQIERAINLLATDVAHFKSKSYKNTNQLEVRVRKAFMKEKEVIRKLNETLRREQKVATKEILDFIENANKSVERHLKDIGNLYDHEEAILEMTTKLDKITTSVGNNDIRIGHNEKLLMEVSGKYSNLKTEDIENLYNTTNDHEEAILETTTKLDKIITAMGSTDGRISQNEKLLMQMSDCGAHKELPNGNVSGNSFVGGTPVISCNPGYSQTGSAQCKVPVTWKTDVKCQKDCAILRVDNGIVTPATAVPNGSTVTVTCDSGYVLVGNNTAVCNDGDFTAVPFCGVSFTDMVVGSLSRFLIKVYKDNRTPIISGAEFLSDGRLVLCDYYNNRIKLISKEFTMIDSLKLQASPWDVSAVNSSTVIVTLPQSKQLQHVHVVPQFKLSSNIQLNKKCRAVDVVHDEIFTSCYTRWGSYDGEVRVYDLGGTLKRTLGVRQDNTYMFESPAYLTVSTNSGNIYVSDVYTVKVTCLSSAGEVMYVYDDPELDGPTGIYVDDGGNTIVCGRNSHNIHIITAGGKKHSILLTSNDGLDQPYSVAYRHSDATLVIGSWNNNNILIFKLEN